MQGMSAFRLVDREREVVALLRLKQKCPQIFAPRDVVSLKAWRSTDSPLSKLHSHLGITYAAAIMQNR